MREAEDRNSMLYWWPKVMGMAIPMPKTEIVERDVTPGGEADVRDLGSVTEEVQAAIDRLGLGLPVFIRTDQMSGKHNYLSTCFYDGSKPLESHVVSLCDESWCADILGIRVRGFAVREFVPLLHRFTAFWGCLPIAKERRYFVKDGEVICHHPYWPVDAIVKPSSPSWRSDLRWLNRETEREVHDLTVYAGCISSRLPGYWSLDFARGRDRKWWFIDAALGMESWHPDCDKNLRPPRPSEPERILVELKVVPRE